MLKKFAKGLFKFSYITVVILFLIACLSPFLNPSSWWFFGFLGLLFPYLLMLLLVFLVIFILSRSKWSIPALLCLIIGWKSIYATFALNIGSPFNKEKKENALRIMTWNVRSFIASSDKVKKPGITDHQMKMHEVIKEYNPDILTFQEFFSADSGKYANNIRYFTQNMGYPYVYFSSISKRRKHEHSGTVIFSRFPIADTARISLPRELTSTIENIIYADIVYRKDTVRIFTGHLQSFGFRQREYSDISKIKNDPDERLDASKNIFKKMRTAFERRGSQAAIIRTQLDESKYPEIFCGDLNDVPNSYTYFAIKGDKKDAFIKKGFGFGKTFYSFFSGFMRKLPTLRIDYIFTDPRFSIQQVKAVPEILSDHIPVVTDVVLEPNR
ncbi:MAG: endonuclease/exonuclease/phosphatase family protein [Chitinophagaceae bacterium]|nr:endonuclease/exonuclease/phosphatase family protein [Chitinophagaceae bacterium]